MIPGEYRRPLEALDARYHGMVPSETGPLVQRLEGHGKLLCWVMGSWQEASQDLHALLELLADAKVQTLGLAREKQQPMRGPRSSLATGGFSPPPAPGLILAAFFAGRRGWERRTGWQPKGGHGPR